MKIKPGLPLAFICALFFVTPLCAQKKKTITTQKTTVASVPSAPQKKYASLLWEITGKGMKKPSYLFGTMHVSNKLVFNLSDSFYNAIKNVEVVALEQNPEVWQQEWADGKGSNPYSNNYYSAFSQANDRLAQQTFAVGNYESKIKLALSSEARMVNGMLYRNNVGMEDFEEETYLDMYIYRMGRKLNKIVTGVEDYKESNRIVKEAYAAMYKDKNRKQRYDYDSYGGRKRMEDAYRRGDLDVLDSLEVASVTSDAFQEKFLYKRNEIQANSIDTIIQKHSLFVGVGAAHLPGERGVIEMLRKKGYKLRPVYTGQRDGEEKDKIEKIRVPLTFNTQYSEDSVFKIDIPGPKLYRYNTLGHLNMLQYADMSNGSYYMATRVKTNASLLGNSIETVTRKTDSLLYENIPGKILSKKPITRNGYNGFDIINKTRKGDVQRYNIFILPDEVLIFKISGIADYITEGKEADQFFSSINFPSKNTQPALYQPPYGGFKVTFPSEPFYIADERNDRDRSEWLSRDANNSAYFIFKTTVQQYEYIEKDSFELRLMEESFTSSKMLKQTTSGKLGNVNRYPVINAKYLHADGSSVKVRYLIQGNNYYVIGAKYKQNEAKADNFINSFEITPFVYKESKLRTDTAVGYTVNSPLFYKTEIDSSDSPSLDMYANSDDDSKSALQDALSSYFIKNIGNDTTGEHVSVTSIRFPQFVYIKDSAAFFSDKKIMMRNDFKFQIRKKQTYTAPGNWQCSYIEYGDSGSSRILMMKSLYHNGTIFNLMSQGDTVSAKSDFIKNVFETFTPSDSIKSFNPFVKKSNKLFEDYFSKDSAVSAKAFRAVSPSLFDSTDLPNVIKAIERLSWNDKNYLSVKRKWIKIASNFKDTVTVNYLSKLYKQVTDTSDLQNEVLDALLDIKTAYSFNAFKNLVIVEPPALTSTSNVSLNNYSIQALVDDVVTAKAINKRPKTYTYYSDYNSKWQPLFDTLQLSAPLLPELMDLMVLEDYKPTITSLLENAIDSGYVKSDQYKQYYNKFLLEAKQAIKKQAAYDSKKEMSKLNDKDKDNDNDNYDYSEYSSNDLSSYSTLLIPFWDHSTEVPALFNKLLTLKDKKTLYNTAVVMVRNNKPVPDSIITKLAADDKYRADLYSALVDCKKEKLFPDKYKTQELMAKSILISSGYTSGNIDSLILINKLQVNQPKYKGWVYFFGYKKNKDDDYKIAMCGLQPLDLSKVNSNDDGDNNDDDGDNDDDSNTRGFTKLTQETYKPGKKDVAPTLQKLLKETLYDLRPSSSLFFGNSSGDDDDDSYISDAAKSSRYE
jgi:uncharacterized protein YbaP (TraB family)